MSKNSLAFNFVVGDLVEFVRDMERDLFTIPEFAQGEVIEVTADRLVVSLDYKRSELAEWNNCVVWTADDVRRFETDVIADDVDYMEMPDFYMERLDAVRM